MFIETSGGADRALQRSAMFLGMTRKSVSLRRSENLLKLSCSINVTSLRDGDPELEQSC
jgi:hypothetical protein